MRRRLRRGLLRDVLAGDGAPDELRIRLQAQGFDDGSVLRIAVVEPAAPDVTRGRARRGRATGDQPAARPRRRAEPAAPPLSDARRRARSRWSSRRSRDAETATARACSLELREAAARVAPEGVVAGCSSPLTGIAERRPGPAAGQGRLHLRPPRPEPRRHRRLRGAERPLPPAGRARRGGAGRHRAAHLRRRCWTTTRSTAPASTRRSARCSSTASRSRRRRTRSTSTATPCRSAWRTSERAPGHRPQRPRRHRRRPSRPARRGTPRRAARLTPSPGGLARAIVHAPSRAPQMWSPGHSSASSSPGIIGLSRRTGSPPVRSHF